MKPDHRKNGTFRRGNSAAVKGNEARVVLAAQRVTPATLARLKRVAAAHGGVGRAIDAAVTAFSSANHRGSATGGASRPVGGSNRL